MSTLTGRDGTALLVVDVQNDVVGQAWHRDEVVGRIAGLVDGARAADVPVVWVQHHDDYLPVGSADWALVDELEPAAGEAKVDKEWGDAFAATNLDAVLADLAVGHIVLCGAQTECCITATTYGAIQRGYDLTLVEDAHTTDDSEFRGRVLPAEQLVSDLVRAVTQTELPGVTVTARPASEIDWPSMGPGSGGTLGR